MSLNAIALPSSSGQPQRLLITLHGWGANAEDLAGLAPFLKLPETHMAFPDAPFAHPHNPVGKMWYGFPVGYNFRSQPNFQQQSDLQASRQQLIDWIHSLVTETGIPLSRTILSGFSQGGAMTLDVGLQLPVAGLMVMSGYLHAPLAATASPLPLLVVHGRQDPVVPLEAAQQARDWLLDQGLSPQYHELEMGHEIQFDALQLMRRFVLETLPTLDDKA